MAATLSQMQPLMETGRLLLRQIRADDLEFVASMLGDPEVMRYFRRRFSRGESEAWIRRQEARYKENGDGYWLIVAKATGTPVGQTGVRMTRVDDTELPGLGYIIHRPYWGNGYATEAAAAVMEYTFSALAQDRVICLVRPENLASQRVALKLGMKLEGWASHGQLEHLLFRRERFATTRVASAAESGRNGK